MQVTESRCWPWVKTKRAQPWQPKLWLRCFAAIDHPGCELGKSFDCCFEI